MVVVYRIGFTTCQPRIFIQPLGCENLDGYYEWDPHQFLINQG